MGSCPVKAPPTVRAVPCRGMATVDDLRAQPWTVLAAAGGVLAMVCAALPWFGVTDVLPYRTGLEGVGDGWYTLGLGLLVVGLAVRSFVTRRRWHRLGTVSIIVGFFVIAIPTLGYSNFRTTAMLVEPSLGDLVSPGIGLYGTVIGGLLMIVAGWFTGRAGRRRARLGRGGQAVTPPIEPPAEAAG